MTDALKSDHTEKSAAGRWADLFVRSSGRIGEHSFDLLIAGYQRFHRCDWPEQRERFEATAQQGQTPRTLVIACSDSRVDPQMILGARPGELFVVRNVANLIPPYEIDQSHHGTSAAIEFAVRVLKVESVLVLGHGMCGGVQMLLEENSPSRFDFASGWMDLAAGIKSATGEAGCDHVKGCEQAVVRLSLANLSTFPWVADAMASGALTLHGGYFDIRHGVLSILQPDGVFADARRPGDDDAPKTTPHGWRRFWPAMARQAG